MATRLSDGVAMPKMPTTNTPPPAPAPRTGGFSGGRFGINKLPANFAVSPASSNPYRSENLAKMAPEYQSGNGYQPVQQSYAPAPATPSFGIGTPDSGGYGGGGQPAPQSKPVMSEGDWLAGDSEYQNQMSEFGTTLADFLARLTKQEDQFKADYGVAKAGLDRNEAQGLLGLGEDFTSRGLANSGLFANSKREAEGNYGRQRDGMNTAKDRALSDFGTQRSDKQASTEAAQNNAKRASLGRMSMNQAF